MERWRRLVQLSASQPGRETVYVTNNGEVVAVLVPPPRGASVSLRLGGIGP